MLEICRLRNQLQEPSHMDFYSYLCLNKNLYIICKSRDPEEYFLNPFSGSGWFRRKISVSALNLNRLNDLAMVG